MEKFVAITLSALFLLSFPLPSISAATNSAAWGDFVLINNNPVFQDAGPDARNILPGTWGSEFGRMAKLSNGNWVAVYSIYDNNGYTYDPEGGVRLQVSISQDNCDTWQSVYTISEPGRDLDNGQIVLLNNGDLLLCCRSVRWQESYRLNVYKSMDDGYHWSYLSTIDQNEGEPGTLGNPDKGVYEPFIGLLDNGEIAAFYSSEKHVTEDVPYAQTVSEKVSSDNGETWGEEILVAWDSNYTTAKPGMPVFTKMSDGRYIVVFEDGYHDDYNVHYKISRDGKTWNMGLGRAIPDQLGAPYITRLSNGRLLLISNSLNLSFSDDNAGTWTTNSPAPWSGSFPDYCWASCYEVSQNKIAVMGSAPRAEGGHNVKLRFGTMDLSAVNLPYFNDFNYGNDLGFAKYGGTWTPSGNTYLMESGVGKALIGNSTWQDYAVEVDLRPAESNINIGIVFRVQNPGAGADEMQGYFAGLDNNGVILGKMNNNWTALSNYAMPVSTGAWYHLKVEAIGNAIKVYANDMETPVIEITDSSFSSGKAGIRSHESRTYFDNLSVRAIQDIHFSDDFNDGDDNGWQRYGGSWIVENGAYYITSGIGKSLTGEYDWQDYTMEADVKASGNVINSGLVVRVSNPGTGVDEMQGYFAGLNGDGVILGKMDNSWNSLRFEAMPVSINTWYHFKIVVSEDNIKVYVDDMDVPKIDTMDSSFSKGKAGVRAFDCKTYFDNVEIY